LKIRMLQHVLTLQLKAIVARSVSSLARRGASFLNARPRLRHRCITLIQRLGLYDCLLTLRLKALVKSVSAVERGAVFSLTVDQLTPRARRIYADLKAAIKNHRASR